MIKGKMKLVKEVPELLSLMSASSTKGVLIYLYEPSETFSPNR